MWLVNENRFQSCRSKTAETKMSWTGVMTFQDHFQQSCEIRDYPESRNKVWLSLDIILKRACTVTGLWWTCFKVMPHLIISTSNNFVMYFRDISLQETIFYPRNIGRFKSAVILFSFIDNNKLAFTVAMLWPWPWRNDRPKIMAHCHKYPVRFLKSCDADMTNGCIHCNLSLACRNVTSLQGHWYLKPRSHALIYTRYVNYTYMYNLHPGVKNYLLRVHMFLKSFGLNRA